MRENKVQKTLPYKSEIVRLGAVLLISITVMSSFFISFSNTKADYSDMKFQEEELNNDYADMLDGSDILENLGKVFKLAKSKDFYGEEDRLKWAEALQEHANKLKLASFKYKVNPQQQVENIGDQFSDELALYESHMELEGNLAHAGDFLSIKDKLNSVPNLFNVNGCQLKKVGQDASESSIEFKCNLYWYTVKKIDIEETSEDNFFDEVF